MNRKVEPEFLDALPAADPQARHSRDDLLRLNAWMRHPAILARQLQANALGPQPNRLLDLGAGDARLIWQVAKRLPRNWRGTHVDLLDKQAAISPEARRGLEDLGWQVRQVRADVSQFLGDALVEAWSVIVANLFLHHFVETELVRLLRLISQRSALFVAAEPRRCFAGLLASRMVGLIGCNQVTRHDAVLSVKAGFTGSALSELWPKNGNWVLQELRIGFFSHLFVARRSDLGERSDEQRVVLQRA